MTMTITRADADKITDETVVNLGKQRNLRGRLVDTTAILCGRTKTHISLLCNDGEFVIDALIV